jgi:hypothetical protein
MASERQCLRALALHEKRLSALPNVQGLGVVAGKGRSAGSDELAVAVYVDRKRPLEELAPEERIPETLELPEGEGGRVRKVPVRVIEQGPVGLE